MDNFFTESLKMDFADLMKNLRMTKDENKEGEIKHYTNKQSILLVGEGDFSFAVSLANAFGDASNMVATSLDSSENVMQKYGKAKQNMEILRSKDCLILHEVDAHTLNRHSLLGSRRFDRIVFNFPHAPAHALGLGEHRSFTIESHQELVRGFLENANKLLASDGQIHITHKKATPFDQWKIVELAEEAGLELTNEVSFVEWDYPGYINKKGEGHGSRCDESFRVGACSTYMFTLLYFQSQTSMIINVLLANQK